MKYLSMNQTVTNTNSYEEKMLGRRICETVDAAEIRYQAKKAKRYRSAFTTGQINYLEKQFKKFPYIGNACRKEVASVLNIPERAVKIWFQNRRMKEKKEVINKEFGLDRPNNSINNVEFVNDPLNNVHSSQSANDHQCSLQPALSNHANKINYTHYNVQVKKSDIVKCKNNIRDKVEHDKLYQFENKNINKVEKPTIRKRMPTNMANLSNIHPNKVYNNNEFIEYLETNKNEPIDKCKLTPKKKIKENFKSGNQPVLDVPNNIPGTINYQDYPEDLSARNKSNVIVPHNRAENINLSSTYVPFCNTQNYITPCISAGSVMWKPVNVMPVISSPSSNIAVIDNKFNQINMVKSNCNCNCHIKNLFNHEQGNSSAGTTHPQYVIAIPINKSMS